MMSFANFIWLSIALTKALGIQSASAQMHVAMPQGIASATPSTTPADLSNPEQLYKKSVAAMRTLQIPKFVTYRSAWTSTGLKFSLYEDDKKVVIALGTGRDFELQHSYSVAYRNVDRMLAVTEDEKRPLLGQGTHLLDPTWTGAYEVMRYGIRGSAPAPAATPAAPIPAPSQEVSTIGSVTAISAAFYSVEELGTGTCPAGTPGRVLKLTAVREPRTHPLTEVTIDDSNNLFCNMRFNLNQSGAVGVTGDYTLRFGPIGTYWLVGGGSVDAAVRFLGIAARHVTLQWKNSDVSPLNDIAPSTFESSTPPTPGATPALPQPNTRR